MPKKNLLIIIVIILFLFILGWAPWLSNEDAKTIVRTYHSFQEQHSAERGQENPPLTVQWLPFCRWAATYEGGWFICFWETPKGDEKTVLPKKITIPENWTFFQNETYNYKIALPKSWPVNAKTPEEVSLGQVPFEPAAGAVFITVLPNKNILYLEEFKQGYPEGCKDVGTPLIANLTALKMVCINSFAGEETNEYFFERGPNLYHISYISGQPELNEIFKKMITTFDFE